MVPNLPHWTRLRQQLVPVVAALVAAASVVLEVYTVDVEVLGVASGREPGPLWLQFQLHFLQEGEVHLDNRRWGPGSCNPCNGSSHCI